MIWFFKMSIYNFNELTRVFFFCFKLIIII